MYEEDLMGLMSWNQFLGMVFLQHSLADRKVSIYRSLVLHVPRTKWRKYEEKTSLRFLRASPHIGRKTGVSS